MSYPSIFWQRKKDPIKIAKSQLTSIGKQFHCNTQNVKAWTGKEQILNYKRLCPSVCVTCHIMYLYFLLKNKYNQRGIQNNCPANEICYRHK